MLHALAMEQEASMSVKATVKRLLRPFNLVMPTHAYGTPFRVPILRGVGGSHRQGTERWMIDAFQRLFRLSARAGLIDVGVNIGQTLLKLRSIDRHCRYVGFEPNPFCIQFVNELITLNGFEQCELLPVALSTRAGLVDFIADSEADSAASMVQELRPGRRRLRKQYIAMLPFDDIAAGLDLAGVPVVKIDVEGAELEVLGGMRGFLRASRPWVICEVLHAHTAAQLDFVGRRNAELTALLGEARYDAYRIVKGEWLASVSGVERVSEFPREAYDPRISPAMCDYLLVPRERAGDTEAAFGH
ncbi:MAG TPA: FkbM family methyltransferase [Albitalea sp.]|uniref:FkbM family methyltransferase n=1 Tax=Piscinibacter sp. TaxID=1903157 RepID=UPI002ED0FC1C